MKTILARLLAATLLCCFLPACDDDWGAPRITIDTPTTEPTYVTTESRLILGGTVKYSNTGYNIPPEIYATNFRTRKRHEANLHTRHDPVRWDVEIPDLLMGENLVTVTVLTTYDYDEASVTIIRAQ